MKKVLFLSVLAIFIGLQSCEEPYFPEPNPGEQQYVVEGFVEAGDDAIPTYVLVTKSIPFISKVDRSTFEKLYVDNAVVTVNNETQDVQLSKLCLNDTSLPVEIKEAVADFFGLSGSVDSLPNICVYVDIFDQLKPQIGQKYDLKVQIGADVTLTSSTTIPQFVPLTKFRWDDPPGAPNDTMARLWVTISDPPMAQYYRYLTEVNDRGLIANFQSVTDDAFFNSQEFEFPLNRASYNDEEGDFNTFGLYSRGDSITVKWMTVDKQHFDFWNTRDFAAGNAGPFASYTRITGNVNGALGIWGGYATQTHRLYCPPK